MSTTNLETIYREHGELVFNLALQYVQNREDAEEITQDVFLTVHEKLDSFREEAKLTTWLYRITINKSLDLIKARKRQKRFAFFTTLFSERSGEERHQVSDFNHPGVLVEHQEELKALFEHINALPDNQRTALILMKLEGRSQAQTAEIMQMSAKAVESLVQRAKKSLSQRIQAKDATDNDV